MQLIGLAIKKSKNFDLNKACAKHVQRRTVEGFSEMLSQSSKSSQTGIRFLRGYILTNIFWNIVRSLAVALPLVGRGLSGVAHAQTPEAVLQSIQLPRFVDTKVMSIVSSQSIIAICQFHLEMHFTLLVPVLEKIVTAQHCYGRQRQT